MHFFDHFSIFVTYHNDGLTLRFNFYWLPNALTSLTLVCGFYSITLALEGVLVKAIHAIMLAMVFDFLDGWVARKTNTVTNFGKEYDSLCDMVAFGLAPAMIVNNLLTWDSALSWIIPAIYSCAVAMRLAHFNANDSASENFQGLPCTAGGPFIVLMCYFLSDTVLFGQLLASITLAVAFLMNSNINYRSLKKRLMTLGLFYVVSILLVGLYLWPLHTLAAVLFLYIVSPILFVKSYLAKRKVQLAEQNAG
ncbi:CDP-diacylglycerol--serine O-phosphatidyltransferase [Candidatus Synchoanobacter obligatus]|uniref:CDP-diacylglycerol--serine O-phosphatidyltransferase n=1 Tax=Candidatus Synchoanobacter obligatus TaxID=2919597 RepID=UPI003014334F